MKMGLKGIALLKQYEGCKLTAYLCSAKVPTIGYGNTYYENGVKVKMGDTITKERAEQLLLALLPKYEASVSKLVKSQLNQNQFDSLVCFCYNAGAGALEVSTLLKKVNANPSDPTIRQEFEKWSKIDGTHNKKDDDGDGLIDEAGEKQTLQGLLNRRKAEANLYFTI